MKKVCSLILALLMALAVCMIHASAVATPLEAGSSMASAATIPNFGVDYVSTLGQAKEVDWFKFVTGVSDSFTEVVLENYNCPDGWNDVHSLNLYLYDINTKQLAHLWGSSRISLKLENSTVYYFKVCMGNASSDGIGTYQITVSQTSDVIPDEKTAASAIALNSTIIQSLDGWGDKDWYKFKTLSSPSNYTVSLIPYNISSGWNDIHSLNLFLYDDNMQQLEHTYNTGTFKIDLPENTTFYIVVQMGSASYQTMGNYEFSVTTDALTPAKTLQSIAVIRQPNKTTYTCGESFDKTGMVVRATYSDGTTEDLTNYSVAGYNPTLIGTQTLTVSATVGGVTRTANFTVRVTDAAVPPAQRTLASVKVTRKPTKTRYTVGEAFDASGLEIEATFSDGTKEFLNASQYTVTGYNANTTGTQTITVTATVNGARATDTFTVSVHKKVDVKAIFQKVYDVISLLWKPISALIKLLIRLIGAL